MKKLILTILLAQSVLSFSQEKFEIKKLGFSMDIPKNWLSFSDEEMIANLNKYDLTGEQIDKFLKGHNQTVSFASFMKYDPKKYAGIIPTIKILMYSNPAKSSAEFLKYVHLMNENVKGQLDAFKVEQNPVSVKVSGGEAVKSGYTFNMKLKGTDVRIRCNTLFIPKGNYFLTLNFIEEIGKEDNSVLFDQLFESIKMDNP